MGNIEGIQIDIATFAKQIEQDEELGIWAINGIGRVWYPGTDDFKFNNKDLLMMPFFLQLTFEPALCDKHHDIAFYMLDPEGKQVSAEIKAACKPVQYASDGHGYSCLCEEIGVQITVPGVYTMPIFVSQQVVHTVRVPLQDEAQVLDSLKALWGKFWKGHR